MIDLPLTQASFALATTPGGASRRALSLGAVLVFLSASGCQLVADFDRSKIGRDGLTDAGRDAMIVDDAGRDAAADAATDAAMDGAADAAEPPPDASPDTGMDARIEDASDDDAGEDDAGGDDDDAG